MLPLAPGLFSITTACLSCSPKRLASSRATRSFGPPGAKPSTNEIGRSGQLGRDHALPAAAAAAKASNDRRFHPGTVVWFSPALAGLGFLTKDRPLFSNIFCLQLFFFRQLRRGPQRPYPHPRTLTPRCISRRVAFLRSVHAPRCAPRSCHRGGRLRCRHR